IYRGSNHNKLNLFILLIYVLTTIFFLISCEEDVRLVQVHTPTAVCAIKSVNQVPYVAGMKIEPLDDVLLSAEGSKAVRSGATLTSYIWEKNNEPRDSYAKLSSPNTAETRFVFANQTYGLDLAGKYKVKLTVTDSFGAQSINDCIIEINAIPSELLHIQLVWDTDYGDMDLHLAKKNTEGNFCVNALNEDATPGPLGTTCTAAESSECNYSNCRLYHHEKRPNWDKDPIIGTSGDPTLDIDDLAGLGPENINIAEASGGQFLVSVHHYAGGRPAGNTVRIYLYGHLFAEFYKILQPNEWWEVATVQWPENISAYPSITDLKNQQTTYLNASSISGNSLTNKQSRFTCSQNSDCGPNTACDPSTNNCVSTLNFCARDQDCPIEKLCVIKKGICVIPECENNRQCQVTNMKQKCDLLTYKCYLP
ncbi:MAG: hypothetical protein O2897_02665, partial [bacterium]|nr:hypothetical protein [bacterium]